MYKKKLGVRVVTAITVGSLLCSNASVAMAAEEVSSIINEHTGDATTQRAATQRAATQTVEIVYYDFTNNKTAGTEVLKDVAADKTSLTKEEVSKYLPKNVHLEDAEKAEYDILNGSVSVAVVADETAKTQTVEITYYDYKNGKTAGTVLEDVAADKTSLTKEEISKYLPENFHLEDAEKAEYDILNGYVNVAVVADETAKTQTVEVVFYDFTNDETAGREVLENVSANKKSFTSDELVEYLPSGYSFENASATYDILNGCVNVAVVADEIPEEQSVEIVFYDYKNDTTVDKITIDNVNVNKKFFSRDELLKYIPGGYDFESNDVRFNIVNGFVNVAVVEKNAKTTNIKLNFYDEAAEKQIAEKDFEVAEDATHVNTGDIAKYVPEGYEIAEVGDLEIRDGYVYVSVRKAAVKNIKLNFYDEAAEKQIAEKDFEVAGDATHVNTGDIAELVPEGYEIAVVGDLEIRDGYVYVAVREVEERTVKLNFYDEAAEKQVAEVEFEVAKDATYVNTGAFETLVPAGYELAVVGDLAIRDGYVYVAVREVEARTVKLNFYDESVEKQIAEVEFEVAKDATYVNTGDIAGLVPAGYELVVVGDLEIRDGYVYVSVREVETKTVKINFYDEEAEKQIAEPSIEVAKDATYVNTSAFEALVPAGYELVLVGDLDIRDGYVYAAVRKVGGGNPDVDKETAVLNVTYKFGDAEVGKETVAASGKAGEAYTFGAKDLTVPAGYALAPSFEDITVEFGASKDVVVEVVEESKVFAANLYVTYKDGDVVVGHSDAVASGLVGGSYIFRIHELKVPEGYVLAEAFNGIEVPYGKTYNIVLQVKKLNPEEMADATLHISYIFNYKEIASEDITVRGKKGESYTFTSENVNLNIPSGYKLKKAMEPTEVQFGETYAITLDLTRRSSGGGSGSSGGGSGSGSGSRSVGTANKLTNGRWILDSVGWWYPFSDNTYAKGGWYYLEWQNKKDWYYFDANGYLVSGWFEENGNKYYLHDVHDGTFGRMYSGWNKIGNQWYYFNDTTTGTFGALDPNAQVPAELLNQ